METVYARSMRLERSREDSGRCVRLHAPGQGSAGHGHVETMASHLMVFGDRLKPIWNLLKEQVEFVQAVVGLKQRDVAMKKR